MRENYPDVIRDWGKMLVPAAEGASDTIELSCSRSSVVDPGAEVERFFPVPRRMRGAFVGWSRRTVEHPLQIHAAGAERLLVLQKSSSALVCPLG